VDMDRSHSEFEKNKREGGGGSRLAIIKSYLPLPAEGNRRVSIGKGLHRARRRLGGGR